MNDPADSIDDLRSHESNAQRVICGALGPLVTLADQAILLYGRTALAVAAHSKQSPAGKVALILTSRLANDLRVCSLLAQLGYGIQGLSIGSTIVELVGALSYVGTDDGRASQWAKHADQRHTFPRRVSEGIEAALTSLSIFSPGTKANWEEAYSFMCTAKHGNPRLSLVNALRVDIHGYYFGRGPDSSCFGMLVSSEALYYGIGFGMYGIHVASAHCSDYASQTQIRAEANRVLEALRGLEGWLSRWREASEEELQGGLVSETRISAIAAALTEETKRIERETDRAKQDTDRIILETRRLREARNAKPSP